MPAVVGQTVCRGDPLQHGVLAPFASGARFTMSAVSLPDRRSAARVRAVIDFLHKTDCSEWAMQ